MVLEENSQVIIMSKAESKNCVAVICVTLAEIPG